MFMTMAFVLGFFLGYLLRAKLQRILDWMEGWKTPKKPMDSAEEEQQIINSYYEK